MPSTSALQALPTLLGTDYPELIDDVSRDLASAVEMKLVQVYASVSVRDSKLTAPTNGMLVYLTTEATLSLFTGGAWVQLWPVPTITSGTAVPANSTGKNGDVFFVV